MYLWVFSVKLEPLPGGPYADCKEAIGWSVIPAESREASESGLEEAARRLGFKLTWARAVGQCDPESGYFEPLDVDEASLKKFEHEIEGFKAHIGPLVEEAKRSGTGEFDLIAIHTSRTAEVENTPGLLEVLEVAKAEARRLGDESVSPEHYLLGIIAKGDGLAVQALHQMEVDLAKLKMELERTLKESPPLQPSLDSLESQADRLMKAAHEIAAEMGCDWWGSEHLLLALIKDEKCPAARTLSKLGVSYEAAREIVVKMYYEPPHNQVNETLTEGC